MKKKNQNEGGMTLAKYNQHRMPKSRQLLRVSLSKVGTRGYTKTTCTIISPQTRIMYVLILRARRLSRTAWQTAKYPNPKDHPNAIDATKTAR